MDYDENDAQDENLHLAGDGNSKVSPVLHSYPLPKFDFDDSLQGHLRFDSLVENEVFLGITSQEDNQWIEEYSRGTSPIQFSSSAVESRRKNVWSEATSSESVEMLLKSVGQEERVVEETIVKESDACDSPGSLTNVMDPKLKQCDEKDHLINTPNPVVPDEYQENFVGADCEQCHATFTSQSQETQNSGGELDSVATGDEYTLSFGEKRVDKISDDANLEGSNLANESFVNELQQDYVVSKVECGNTGSPQKVDASIGECQENPQEVPETCTDNASGLSKNFHNSEPELSNSMDNLTNSGVIVETCVVSNVESLDKPSVGGSIPVCEEPTGFSSSGCVDMQEIEDANTKSEVPDPPKSNVGSRSHLQTHSIEETKNDVKSDARLVTCGASLVSSGDNLFEIGDGTGMPAEDISDKATGKNSPKIDTGDSNDEDRNLPAKIDGLVQVDDATPSSDQDVTFNEREDARLPLASLDMDMDVVGAPDSQKNVEPSLSAEGCEGVLATAQVTSGDDHFEMREGSDVNGIGRTPLAASSSVEMIAEDISDEAAEKNSPNIHIGDSNDDDRNLPVKISGLVQVDDATPSSGQDVTFNEREDAKLPLDSLNMDMDVVGAPDIQKHVEPSLSAEGCEEVLVTAQITSGPSMVSSGEGKDFSGTGRTTLAASSLAEMPAEDISDEAAGKNSPNIHTGDLNGDDQNLPAKISGQVQVGDATPSSDQDVTFSEREDAKLPLMSLDMDKDVVGAPYSQKNVEPSSSAEGCEGGLATAQGSESNMAVLTDPVAAVEPSNISSSDTLDGVQLPSVATGDIVTDNQPRSPILGVSLLQDDNEEKEEVGFSIEGNPQKGTPEVDSTVDYGLDGPIPVVKKDAVSDGAENVVYEPAGHCGPPVENRNISPSEQTIEDTSGGLRCSNTLESNPRPCDLSAKGGSNAESAGLLDTKKSMTGEDGTEPLNLAVNMSDERQASVDVSGPSEHDTNHVLQKEGGSASLDKPQDFSFTDTKSVEFSQSAKDKHEITKVSNDREGLQSVPPSSATKEEKSFTFEVSASAGSGHTVIQNLSLSKKMGSSASSCGGISDPNKLHGDSLVSPQTPSSAGTGAGAKGNSERKPRRSSLGRETSKKGNHLKETTPTRRSGRVEKSPALLTPVTGNITRREELKSNESIKCISSNSSNSIFQQSFNDNQQLQLRAQILVYGSLISGMPPEEPHMIAAFGQSDGGRRAWEAAWHACLERVRSHKSQANNPGTPMQSRPGNKDPNQEAKIGSAQIKVLSTPTAGPSHMSISSPVSSVIPISSPLWNISTPCDGLQSSAMPRSPLLDYRQTLSSLHLYQTPQVQNFAGQNPSWPSQGPFPGQWLASSPIATFSPRFSALPITEAVKLTTVKESGAPGIPVIPVDHSTGPSISPGSSALSNVKKAIISSGQPSSDSKSRKRKKADASMAVSQSHMSVPIQTPVASLSVHLPQLPWAPVTEGHNQTSFLVQNQINSGTVPVVSNHTPTSAVLSTAVSVTSKSNPGSFRSAISPAYTTHGHPRLGDQNIEKIITRDEIMSKVEESKLQAADAAVHAAASVSHCQGVWSQLETRKSSGLVSDDEAKLSSSAVCIAAAASVAKVAAAAAKIASNVAEQAKLMADEVFQSSSSMVSRANVDKATPVSILNSADGSDHPTSIISAAREAARRRIEAASAASKHAENLDAIVKAAELAAEAVSQTGKIVSMGNPLPLKELVEAGPHAYWKTPHSLNQQHNSESQNVEAVPNDKEIHTSKRGFSLREGSQDLAKNQMIIDGISGSVTSYVNDKSTTRASKGPDSSKTMGVIPESEFESDVGQSMPQTSSGTWKESNIKEGCLVEVFKDNNSNKGAWFVASIQMLKDGKAFVCYKEIQSDDGSGQLKEWVPLKAEGTEPPRIRIAHPTTTMRFEGTRKRGRRALSDYDWCSGDRVDVWVQDRWCEAIVVERNKIDVTSITVQFPAQEEASVVRSWHVRPTLIWKDGKWIEWSNIKGNFSSEGDTRHEKRQKYGSPVMEGTEKDKSSNSVDLVESGRVQESMMLPLSAQGSSFNVGKSSRDENKLNTRKTMRSGLQKERSGVVFGVPKPGKKQKFMDVSKHYVKNTPNDSVNVASYSIMPRAPGPHELKNISKNDAKEQHVAETRSKVLKSRKPPVPSRLVQKEKPKSSKSTPSVGVDESAPRHQNRMEFQNPNNEDATKAPSSSTLPSDTRKGALTSKDVSRRLNKRKFAPGDQTSAKMEVKDESTSEAEPRRSNRKIQPTSRLLEGLQSSLTISHGSQRSYKVTSKGNTNAR